MNLAGRSGERPSIVVVASAPLIVVVLIRHLRSDVPRIEAVAMVYAAEAVRAVRIATPVLAPSGQGHSGRHLVQSPVAASPPGS